MSEPKNDQIEFGNHDKTPKPAWPWAGLLLVVLLSLLMPISVLLLITARTSEPGQQELLHFRPPYGRCGPCFRSGWCWIPGAFPAPSDFQSTLWDRRPSYYLALGILNIMSALGALFILSRP